MRCFRIKFRLWLRGTALALLCTVPLLTQAQEYRLETWADGLQLPWSLVFLPQGGALVTELGGTLRRIDTDGVVSAPLANVPEVYFAGQGGLFDLVLHPDFARNGRLYLSFAEGTEKDNGIAVARAELGSDKLDQLEIIFRNFSRKDTAVHYGGRMVFLPDGTLLLTTGEGFDYREAAQDVSSGLGKVLRMTGDGAAAPGNPWPDSPYVYTLGHRNPQGLAVGKNGKVWLHEHGPRGGDELNILEPGVNYGWPAATRGVDYSGAIISPFAELEGMRSPVYYWVPSIAPSGLAIYQGSLFPQWQGSLFIGALVDREVRRLDLAAGEVIREEPMFGELDERVRDVRNGPDGALYILLPDRIVRVVPR